MFTDRKEAGRRLAEKLTEQRWERAIVLAIPRGGVVVGYEMAHRLKVPLDVIVPRKIGAPHNPELAIGAIAEDGTMILDSNLIDYLGVTDEYIREEGERQIREIERRVRKYRKGAPPPDLKGRNVIIVDDGIATGATVRAAIASIRNKHPKSITLAVPVAPPSTLRQLKSKVDRIVCLSAPEPFFAIGQFYMDFTQTADEEVIRLLEANKEEIKFSVDRG